MNYLIGVLLVLLGLNIGMFLNYEHIRIQHDMLKANLETYYYLGCMDGTKNNVNICDVLSSKLNKSLDDIFRDREEDNK